MKKIITILLILLSLMIFVANIVLADTGSTELIEKGKEYDGKPIAYTGEVIGDPLSRGAYVWLNVKDKDNAMGIWAKKSLLPKVRYYGRYNKIGDTLVIRGLFHRSCIEHGGDMDIHANTITISKAGHSVKHPVQKYKLIVAVICLFTAGLSYYFYKFRKKV